MNDNNVLMHFMRASNTIASIKDRDSVIMAASPGMARILGIHHEKDLIGRTDFDLPNGVAELAGEYKQQDLQTMSDKTESTFIDFTGSLTGGANAFLTTKGPLVDDDDEAYGVYVFCMKLSQQLMCNLLNLVIPKTCLRSEIMTQTLSVGNASDIELSSREQECLFFLLRGKTAAAIGNLLHISPRTVEKHIERLKIKLDVYSKPQLIEKAIALGYFYNIPNSLLGRMHQYNEHQTLVV